MDDFVSDSKTPRLSRTVNDTAPRGQRPSRSIHMFNYDLPPNGLDPPEVVGLCMAAVAPTAAVRDWAQVTCRICLRKRKDFDRAKARARYYGRQ
jgi:hypothetical protein